MAKGEHRPAATGLVVHVALAAIPVVMAIIVACSSGDDGEDSSSGTTEAASGVEDEPGTKAEVEDFEMQAEDFVALKEMTAVRGFFMDNHLGHLDEAIAVAENPDGGVYPVGTVIQLVPQEAMVKRAPGFDPTSNDWEFFALEVSGEGTTIATRGGSEVINQFGGLSCVGCHSKAEPQFDFVCEKDHGCDPLPIGDEVIKSVQDADPR